jgi:hypothetical protein
MFFDLDTLFELELHMFFDSNTLFELELTASLTRTCNLSSS